MKAARLSLVFFILIIAGPVIALNVMGIDPSTILGKAGVISDENPADAASEPEDPYAWLRDQPELRETFVTDEITSARLVTVQKVLTAQEILNAGEAMPEDAFMPLYAAARAPARLMPYCAELVATVALSCDVIHSEAYQNREGKWVMDGRLAFVPAAPLGNPADVENGQLVSADIVLPYIGDLRPPNDAETRRAMLTQAQTTCDVLRAQLGNCVLTHVDFDVHELWITDLEALPAGTNPQRLEATAQFTVYADPAALDNDAFATMVTELVNPS